MDKRNIRRRAMHGNLFKKPTISKSSDEEEDMFVKASQNSSKKLSNTQRLRMIESQSKSQNQENSQLNSGNDNTPKKKKQRSPTLSPKRSNNLLSSKKSPPVPTKTPSKDDDEDSLSEVETSPPLIKKSQKIRSLNHTKKRITESPQTSVQKKQRKNRNQIENDEDYNYVNLETFFRKCGITISDSNDQQVFSIENDSLTTVKKVQEIICSGVIPKNQVITDWKTYLEDVNNVRKLMEPTIVTGEQRLLGSSAGSSVVRILLQVPVLQTEIMESLLTKLVDSVLIANSMDEVQWTRLLLQQFRFLEIIHEPELLTTKLEELLEASPIWFQQELIVALPDIVTDPYHQTIAEILCRLMEENKELTNGVINCIGNLSLGTEYHEELRQNILNILNSNNCPVSNMSELVKFCIADCSSIETFQKVLKVIRQLDIKPLDGENCEEYYTSQMLIVQALKLNMRLSKKLSNAVVTILLDTYEQGPTSIDFILLLLLCNCSTTFKKKGENILKKQIKCGYYRASLLNDFYDGFKEVARDLQTTALNESSTLLKSGDTTLVKFADDWIRQQFKIHSKILHIQQEIIGKIILLMGNNDQTAKNALAIFQAMTVADDEKRYLQNHCNHLRILIDKIDQLDLDEVATLNDILYALCIDSNSTSNALEEDLMMLFHKQLASADSFIVCKGVAGAVMAIKHSAQNRDSLSSAKKLFNEVVLAVQDCPRAQGLFYDNISEIIANESIQIDHRFLTTIVKSFENKFAETCLSHKDDYRGDLVPKFELNSQFNYYVLFGETKYGAIVPALFRLIKICFKKIPGNLDELMSCAILMPKDLETPEPRTLDMIFTDDPIIKRQVIQRLDNLMHLQGELYIALSILDNRYKPPPCYFTKIPPPPFIRLEKSILGNGFIIVYKNTMYFRRLDASVAHLLETDIDNGLKTSHVCFLVKELLSMLADETMATRHFVDDLVKLLPKICSQLKYLVQEIRDEPESKEDCKQTIKLLFELLSKILAWKGFDVPSNNEILKTALKTLAEQCDRSNINLQSKRETISASYTYFESLSDIVTHISLAYSLVNLCKELMKHSKIFADRNRERQSKMAYGFLCLEWTDDQHVGPVFNSSVTGLLKNWMDYEEFRLDRITNVLENLPEEVENLERPRSNLETMRTISRVNFHHFFRTLFDGLISGIRLALSATNTEGQKVQVWHQAGKNLKLLMLICRKIPTKSVLRVYLRCMPIFLKQFINCGIPVLEKILRYQPEEITKITKLIQAGTKFLNAVCCHATEKKDISLTNLVPAAKLIVEQLLYQIKAMLVANHSSPAFWMGNLINKNLDGEQILSQNTSDEQSIPDVTNDNSLDDNDLQSDVLSDVESSIFDLEAGGDEDDDDATNDNEQVLYNSD
ncbi:hypothetical protein HCN44_007055 [Aphidius gifuensis]|uniref:Fanconi anemia group D2 protein n=1 Tax=Aphidius gifuensis TaxID=684658 RepID=A0A835CQ30_APHGI|nr:hypothetical protein HCN44_007055 [Aphidius gifuensis]